MKKRFIITTNNGIELSLIFCVGEVGTNGLPEGSVSIEGRFSVDATDTAALATIQRLWLAGASSEVIVGAMALGLLPPKAK